MNLPRVPALQPRYRELAMNPQVLTLQLVWDQNVSGDEIRNTLSQVEERLDITRMYNDLAVSRQGLVWWGHPTI